MQPEGTTAIAMPMAPPRLPRLSSLRCLLCLRIQFSTAYRSSWSLRPIGALLVSLREAQLGPVWLKETAYEFRQ